MTVTRERIADNVRISNKAPVSRATTARTGQDASQ
jgi:hypothetical protein